MLKNGLVCVALETTVNNGFEFCIIKEMLKSASKLEKSHYYLSLNIYTKISLAAFSHNI